MIKRVNWSRRHTFRQELQSEMTFHIIAQGFMSRNACSQVERCTCCRSASGGVLMFAATENTNILFMHMCCCVAG